jgi:PhoPQ-activated pathogenicity-related protein
MTRLSLKYGVAAVLVGLMAFGASAKAPVAGSQTALDRYVHAQDDSYGYRLESTLDGDGAAVHVIELTSQTWRSPDEVDRTVWKHWMRVYVPEKVLHDTALMYIGGGNNDNPAPQRGSTEFAIISKTTQSVVVELGMIPNQHLVFSGDGRRRNEDALIAYTWDKFLRTGDENWPARMPMTKSVVRAMDAVQDFCAKESAGGNKIKSFVVAGGSKRGWTTWTTAAVDKRVKAIVPIVIDMLNVVESFKHHWEAYGFWAPAVGDYEEMGLMNWMGTPEYDKLLELVEPYSYIKRYTMPKLIMNSCGDQFFLPDSSQFYWDDLVGDKYLRYVPNTGHGLDDSDALFTLMSFYHSIISDTPIPQYSWSYGKKGNLTVKTPAKPIAVNYWTATNTETRDFRVDEAGQIWKSVPVEPNKNGAYKVKMSAPEKGWTAHMVELTFEGPGGTPLKFTTPIKVLPEECPFEYTPPANPPKGYLSK